VRASFLYCNGIIAFGFVAGLPEEREQSTMQRNDTTTLPSFRDTEMQEMIVDTQTLDYSIKDAIKEAGKLFRLYIVCSLTSFRKKNSIHLSVSFQSGTSLDEQRESFCALAADLARLVNLNPGSLQGAALWIEGIHDGLTFRRHVHAIIRSPKSWRDSNRSICRIPTEKLKEYRKEPNGLVIKDFTVKPIDSLPGLLTYLCIDNLQDTPDFQITEATFHPINQPLERTTS
jgi:hypothetical protein